jgi:DNA invertase Pin-like site-specific DNA recombinase
VIRQLEACRERAQALGWSVVGVYEDNDVSASGTKPRPQYQQMLAELDAGRADAAVVWDLDRLTHRPIEIDPSIELADRRGVALASVGGDVDLSTDNGRMFTRIEERWRGPRWSGSRLGSGQRAAGSALGRGTRQLGAVPSATHGTG